MPKPFFLAEIALILTSVGFAKPPGWIDAQGHAPPDTEFRKSKDGFGGIVIVTSDRWKKKWETSPTTIPNFRTTDTVRRGETVFVLTFFTNPGLDDHKNAAVTCDIDNDRPDGSSSVHQTDIPCARGRFKGDPNNVYLSPAVVQFVGEPGDPAGKWTVRVVLNDNIRHVRLALKTSFVLK